MQFKKCNRQWHAVYTFGNDCQDLLWQPGKNAQLVSLALRIQAFCNLLNYRSETHLFWMGFPIRAMNMRMMQIDPLLSR